MPSRDWRFRILDIVQAVTAIQQRVNTMTFEDFRANETLIKAVLYDFLIIGEAALNIPSEIQLRYPHIPWRVMGDMRNVMAHEYFQVNLSIIWRTIENNLTAVLLQLQELIELEGIEE
ncbi:MAG: DUF86 domain-containing protein [Scytonematopsis contorta HA4267-MV1]|nr:DUF86 domain-containing protein [Scytonematopsis contorta HA4267-MV1]